jgi:diguanylate cyclase (GGDEF)-like protein
MTAQQTATDSHAKASSRAASALRRARRVHPVWGLSLALITAAAALYAGPVRGLQPLAHPHLPWWAIAIAFAVAERCVVYLHFRRGAHSFSLGDIPIVFGLIFCSAESLVIGCLLGCLLVLLVDRRLPPVKIVFNLGQLALHLCIALLIVHALAVDTGHVDTRTWVSALIAMQASSVLASSLIASAISLSEGLVRLATLTRMIGMDLVVTTSNASLGLCGVVITASDVHALPLLVVPAATLFAAYRAYLSEAERHKRLEFLYEANRTLARSREIAPALEGLLVRSLEAFRAEMAEIILFGSEENPSLRTLLGPGSYRELMEPVDSEVADEMRHVLGRSGGAITLDSPFGGGRLQRYLEARGVTHAIVAPLPGEERVIGAIMLANRFGVVRSFDREDRRLLDTLASNASVALQYDRLEQAVNQLSVLQEQLHHQAYHDPLTSLANRSLFTDKVREAIADRRGEVAVLFIDLDDFKTVNDSLGHAAGDELLVAVASRLRVCLRPQDLVARLGGDEFAVMVQDSHDAEAAAAGVARRIMEAFVLPVDVGSESVAVCLSVGIAASHGGGDFTAEELIRDADVAMYRAKTNGKGHFQVFHPSMGAAVLERHGLKEELRLAIERQELTLYFQPIIDLDTGRLIAEEALVRWEHPRRGLVGPSEFVPLAEETGLILSLGQYVLEEACRQARRWQAQDAGDRLARNDVAVHVNLSAVELRDPELVRRVRTTLETSRVDPCSVVFEITETVLLDETERVAATIGELRDLGVRFALDDFGTGYSSLSYLHTLPFDMLKIAKSFVDGLARGGREASFVRMIIELARTLGVTVIAEGIESQDQLDALVALECDLGQGFHLGRPQPVRPELALRSAA